MLFYTTAGYVGLPYWLRRLHTAQRLKIHLRSRRVLGVLALMVIALSSQLRLRLSIRHRKPLDRLRKTGIRSLQFPERKCCDNLAKRHWTRNGDLDYPLRQERKRERTRRLIPARINDRPGYPRNDLREHYKPGSPTYADQRLRPTDCHLAER